MEPKEQVEQALHPHLSIFVSPPIQRPLTRLILADIIIIICPPSLKNKDKKKGRKE